MAHTRTTERVAFPAVIVLSILVSLLPARWVAPWSSELGEVLRFPLTPFTHVGSLLANWLRPAPDGIPIPGSADAQVELIRTLEEQRDRAERLFRRERARVERLEAEVKELQQLPDDVVQAVDRRLLAYVTARTPGRVTGTVQLRLQPGAGEVPEGTVVLYGGAHLLGRTIAPTGSGFATLLPITHRASGVDSERGLSWISGKVAPRGDRLESGVLIQMSPRGDGSFEGEVDAAKVVEVGDRVWLHDDSWPTTAQYMIIGEVRDISISPSEPLRNVLVIRPFFQAHQIATATLLVQDLDAEGAP